MQVLTVEIGTRIRGVRGKHKIGVFTDITKAAEATKKYIEETFHVGVSSSFVRQTVEQYAIGMGDFFYEVIELDCDLYMILEILTEELQ